MTFAPDLFAGRTAVVTGGTSGIGAAIATHLARHGATVHAVGLKADEHPFDAGLAITPRELDVTDEKGLADLFGDLDALDILVPAAGITMNERELDPDVFARVIGVNLNAVMRCCALGLPLLRKSGKGSIVTIASMYATFGGKERAAYAASKGGIVQLTKSLAQAYAPDGIRVNAVAPGWIDTPLMAPLKADAEISGRLMTRLPLGRFGQPEEIADAVAFLCSDAAAYITGVNLPIDGGYLTA